jgi:hypothetical protein
MRRDNEPNTKNKAFLFCYLSREIVGEEVGLLTIAAGCHCL